eukprot:CAMPEP_0194062444 /NCGR_PEP_ID=MMETSP0009_2-20130614/77578_1 /TAXON_ID=210454 /ORGANISM="Grammatophora oceanica, Strain CCMP 410" /LENGTH=80 /DNA_ID=CAMNT_0038714189 /DNA_START=124 /DNA_END=363 /DNA_ORIENTATION=-
MGMALRYPSYHEETTTHVVDLEPKESRTTCLIRSPQAHHGRISHLEGDTTDQPERCETEGLDRVYRGEQRSMGSMKRDVV